MELSNYRYLLAPLVLGYWLVCFAPYNWVSPVHNFQNDAFLGAASSADSAGSAVDAGVGADPHQILHFGGQGLATIEAYLGGIDNQAPKEFFLSLDLQCELSEQFGPARIITFSDNTLSRHFMLGHQGTALVLRWLRPGSDSNGDPSFTVEDYFSDCKPRQLELTADGAGLVLESEGSSLLQLPSVSMERWIDTYPVRLGNEGTWNRGWAGQMSKLRLQIDDRVLADGWDKLQIPESEWLLTQSISNRAPVSWLPFYATTSQALLDTILNVMGFLPFGALLALAWRCRMNLWKAGALSALLSLSIEVGQLGVEGRYTSTADLVTNTIGGVVGYFLVKHFWSNNASRMQGGDDE